MGRRTFAYLTEKFLVLLLIVWRVRSQKTASPVRLRPPQGVELMVAHDGQSRARFTHASRDTKHLLLVWPAIDKIANKNYPAILVTKYSAVITIAHFL
jgi:hypothetical protein